MLHGSAAVRKITVQDLYQSEGGLEYGRRLVERIQQLRAEGAGEDGNHKDLVLLGGAVGAGLQGLEDSDVVPEVLGLSVLVDELPELADALNNHKGTISLVSEDCSFCRAITNFCLIWTRSDRCWLRWRALRLSKLSSTFIARLNI